MHPQDEISNYKFGVFYFNPNDTRIIVPKRMRALGWTFNFARPLTYIVIVSVMAILMYISYVTTGEFFTTF